MSKLFVLPNDFFELGFEDSKLIRSNVFFMFMSFLFRLLLLSQSINVLFEFGIFLLFALFHCLEENQRAVRELLHDGLETGLNLILVWAFFPIEFVKQLKLFSQLTHALDLSRFEPSLNALELPLNESLSLLRVFQPHL